MWRPECLRVLPTGPKGTWTPRFHIQLIWLVCIQNTAMQHTQSHLQLHCHFFPNERHCDWLTIDGSYLLRIFTGSPAFFSCHAHTSRLCHIALFCHDKSGNKFENCDQSRKTNFTPYATEFFKVSNAANTFSTCMLKFIIVPAPVLELS